MMARTKILVAVSVALLALVDSTYGLPWSTDPPTFHVVRNGSYEVAGGTVDAYRLWIDATEANGDVETILASIAGPMYQVGGNWVGVPYFTPFVSDLVSYPEPNVDTHIGLTRDQVKTGPMIIGTPETNDFRFLYPSPSLWEEGLSHEFYYAFGIVAGLGNTRIPALNVGVLRGAGDVNVTLCAGTPSGRETPEMVFVLSGDTTTPAALPGGPYVLDPGQEIYLDAAEALPGFAELWAWDLDGDGEYDDAVGQRPTLSFDELLNDYGLNYGSNTISLMVQDDWGNIDFETTTLTLIPEPATLVVLAMGGLAVLRRRRRG